MIQGVIKYFELVKFSHTIFALPFPLISALIGSQSQVDFISLSWIILAMVGARTGAMGFNRWSDKKWDQKNPRTKKRHSATGEVSDLVILFMVLIAFSLLVLAAWKLNPLAFYLSPLAIFLVCFYSYTKRFTSISHILLGIAIGSAPVAAWIALTGEISQVSLYLGLSVMVWIAGFDILYALQDLDFDREVGLHSIPARFGIAKSLWIARAFHLLTLLFWLLIGLEAQLGIYYYLGIGFCSALLLYEHSLLRKDDLSKLNMAFFNVNAVISCVLFVSIVADLFFLNL